MAHFAKLDANNIVTQVIVVADSDTTDMSGLETEALGVAFCQRISGASTNWKQTSYNERRRGNYAGIGYTYMTNVATLGVGSTDIFINPQPFGSWTIGVNTASWYAPIAGPPELTDSQKSANQYYIWDEDAHQADSASPKTVGWALTT